MSIFAELVLFCLIVTGIVDYIRVRLQNKVLSIKVDTLTEKNSELLELLTRDEADRLGEPPKGQKILYG